MSQSRLTFELELDQVIPLSTLVEDLFEEDGYPVASFEINETTGIWGISVYTNPDEINEAQERLKSCLEAEGITSEITIEDLGDQNWVAKTLSDLAPVRAGRFVVHGTHDQGCAKASEIAILVDAGMAFGTGHHGTTAGCLAMIDRELKRTTPLNAMDVGSGTGVLAIAVAKAKRIGVLATDIDPVADQIAQQNAKANQVNHLVESITATGFHHRRISERGPYDLVIANILAGPLQAMACEMAMHLADNATVILSGLLPHQKARILATYRAQGLVFDHAHYQNGWMTLVLKATHLFH